MRFQYIIGRSGVGKSEYALQQMSREIQAAQGQTKYFYLVPDQMSFQTEWQLLQRLPAQSMSNVFVYSFKNIVKTILTVWEQQSGDQLTPISDLGMQMIVRKVLLEQHENLQVYQKIVKQPGFTKHMLDCLAELENWQVDEAEYDQVLSANADEAFQQKMQDLALIQREVANQLAIKQVVSTSQQLAKATQLLQNKQVCALTGLQDAVIVIDGFHSFNKQEQQFLQALSLVAKQTTLILTVDRPYGSYAEYEQSETFQISGKTYWQMRQFTNQMFADDEVAEVWLHPQAFYRSEQPSLQQLEKWLADAKSVASLPLEQTEHEALHVIGAMNRLREVEAVAQAIRQRILQGARYQEIAVYVSQTSDYYHLIKRIFPLYDLPFFLDEKTPMHFHPILETIIGSLQVSKNNWQYDDIFRTVKNGFFNHEQQVEATYFFELAAFEQYCLQRGKIGRKHWHAPTPWEYREVATIDQFQQPLTPEEEAKTAAIAKMRQQIVEPLQQLEAALKAATTVQAYSEAIFHFLQLLAVPEQLLASMERAQQAGDVTKAKQDQQVWQKLVQVMDEIVAIAGDDEIDLATYILILEAGFEQLTFQLAPPALDQILVGDFERARFQMAKTPTQMGVTHAFVLGVNEGKVPFVNEDSGLLTQADRERFAAANIQLAPDLRGSIASQRLNFYMLATTARQSVTFSYVLAAGENGEDEQYPARILQQLCHVFGLSPTLYPQQLGEIYEPYSLTPQATYRYLHYHLQQMHGQVPLAPIWQATYNWLMTHDANAYFIQRSLNYQNKAVTIAPQLVKGCFGQKISGTATRIETYNRCPYRFYAQYMLHLEQPSDYEVSFLQIGNLYHHCLEFISGALFAANRSFASLSPNDIEQFTTQAIQQLHPYLQYHAFYETARSRYLLTRLQQNVMRSVQRLVEIDQHSQFDLRFAEVSFGQRQSIYAAREYELSADYRLSLRGKIDRIDTLETPQGTYVRIIDYKSTDKSINFDEIYHGLSLQMPMYLDVATKDILPEALAAGMFYFTIQNKKQALKQTELIGQTGDPQQQLLGYALADPDIIAKLDDTFLQGATEYIKSIKKTSKGIDKRSMVLSKQELTNLTTFTNEKIMASAKQIIAGEIPIQPTGIEKLPCEYCPYRSLCSFDQQLPENPGCYASKGHRSDVLVKQGEEE